MDNRQKLREIFARELAVDETIVVDELAYNTIKEWDSVAHMRLVAAIDDGFDIMLDAEDVIDMSTFAIAIEILKKYDVEF